MRPSSALFCLLLLSSACNRPETQLPTEMAHLNRDSIAAQLQNGDIVLRRGRDELSRLFRNLNAVDRRFSHCGIFVHTSAGPKVIHIIESGSDSLPDLRFDDFSRFIAPAQNESFRVIRYSLDSSQQARLPQLLDSLKRLPVHFDIRFRLDTDTQLYCSELVYKVLRQLEIPDTFFQLSESNSGRRFIGVDGLYLKNQHKTICEIRYK